MTPKLVNLVESFHFAFFSGNHFCSTKDRSGTLASGRML